LQAGATGDVFLHGCAGDQHAGGGRVRALPPLVQNDQADQHRYQYENPLAHGSPSPKAKFFLLHE